MTKTLISFTKSKNTLNAQSFYFTTMRRCFSLALLLCVVICSIEARIYNKLNKKEQSQGYVLLFNGSDLSFWTGDTINYRVDNNCIKVTAEYGDENNLYTKKEYRNFHFKFDFCFTEPGVNNGVGIRTPMGKDAAYWGMCEVQILDHDAPCYEGLADYQVHGSAYGLVPAKRVPHKGIGKWNSEEIIVHEDSITVILNGETILVANLRDACQGHNMAPENSTKNPYTRDHKSHPGLFNERGHIGFLGHGKGLMLRNIRIKEL